MKKRLLYFLLSIFTLTGLIFFTQNTYAIPTESPDHSVIDTEASSDAEVDTPQEGSSCYDRIVALGWLVCPLTRNLAKAIDGLYSAISSILVVSPISTDTSSPIYLVWEYMRNITNIIFIIFILVIIYSQLTGFAISNYGVKRAIPRIIIAAILINLSFLICAIAVDVSNILGSAFIDFFANIRETAFSTDPLGSNGGPSMSELASVILGLTGIGTVTAIAGLAALGGLSGALIAFIPIVFAGLIAVLVAFITIAARQALIFILIMIAPLAFIAYLLPNTEKWFTKWRTLLLQMLFFYPIFSILFGASQLAGQVIIASATNWIGIILGIAVQIFPLFAAFSLLKMSGTIPGRVGEFARKPFAPAQRKISELAASQNAIKRAEHTRKGLLKPKMRPFSSAYWAGAATKYNTGLSDRTEKTEEEIKMITSQYLNAKKIGKRIIGHRKDGSPIFSKKAVSVNKTMQREYTHRAIKLRSTNSELELENTMGTMGDYLKNNTIDTSKGIAAQIKALTKEQAENYLDNMTLQKATSRNDAADRRFYHESVEKAFQDGEGSLSYKKLIIRAGGADALSSNAKIRHDARASVIADATVMAQADRIIQTEKYTTYFNKLQAPALAKFADESYRIKNIDAIVAANTVMANRGDTDKLGALLQKYLDSENGTYLELGTDTASTLALNLLSLKGRDPTLAKTGKSINVETFSYLNTAADNPNRRSKYFTIKEVITGVDNTGIATKSGGIETLLRGTSFADMERTALDNIRGLISNGNYFSPEDQIKKNDDITQAIMPQIIAAIPSFGTNSEQLMSILGYLTGLKYTKDPNDPNSSADWRGSANQVREEAITTYLSALTPENLIHLKTDALQATLKAFEYLYGNEAAAKQKFKNIQINNGNIAKLNSFEPSKLAPMKDSLMKILDIKNRKNP